MVEHSIKFSGLGTQLLNCALAEHFPDKLTTKFYLI